MSYQPGRMGLAEGLALVFVANFAPAFLSIWSIFLGIMSTALWMSPLINTIFALGAIFATLYAMKITSGDYFATCTELLGRHLGKIIVLFSSLIYLLEATFLLRQFTEDTLLDALPKSNFELIVFWYLLVVIILLYFGIEAISRTCYIILPISIIAVITVLLLLLPECEPLYLTPWNGSGLSIVLHNATLLTGYHISGFIPIILASSFQKTRTVRGAILYGLIISSLLRALILIVYIACFGVGSGQEKLLPFYELTRLVYINRFLERIESLFIILWTIAGLLSIAINLFVGLYLLGRIFNLPTLRPLILPIAVISGSFALLPKNISSVVTLHANAILSLYNIMLIIIPLLLFVAAVYRQRRQA